MNIESLARKLRNHELGPAERIRSCTERQSCRPVDRRRLTGPHGGRRIETYRRDRLTRLLVIWSLKGHLVVAVFQAPVLFGCQVRHFGRTPFGERQEFAAPRLVVFRLACSALYRWTLNGCGGMDIGASGFRFLSSNLDLNGHQFRFVCEIK